MTDSEATIRPRGEQQRTSVAAIRWESWVPESFARARARRAPVLLSLTASWCHGCAVMDRLSYADPGIAATINARFVPVRVDVDRRPDIYDRYNLEGLPTTAFLTPSGEILTGSTYLPPERLASMLVEVADAYDARGDALEQRATGIAAARRAERIAVPDAGEPDLSAPDWLAALLTTEADPLHGGFGLSGKFLEVAALRAGLARFARTRDGAVAKVLGMTLQGIAEGGLRDRVEGGFFRYAAGRDWTRPHTEKLLEDQAGVVALFVEAADLLGDAGWREVARETVQFVSGVLAASGEPGFFASRAGDEVDHQAPTVDARRAHRSPAIDRTRFTDRNAQTAAAWLRASQAWNDAALAEAAGATLDDLLAATYRPGDGISHWPDESAPRGLLTDQVHLAAALLDLYELTDNETCADLAEDLMRTAYRTLWDESHGGFFDRRPTPGADVGLLADRLKPLTSNCLAARTLSRLAVRTGDAEFQRQALATLRAQTAAYRRHGLAGAPYAHAVLDVVG